MNLIFYLFDNFKFDKLHRRFRFTTAVGVVESDNLQNVISRCKIAAERNRAGILKTFQINLSSGVESSRTVFKKYFAVADQARLNLQLRLLRAVRFGVVNHVIVTKKSAALETA